MKKFLTILMGSFFLIASIFINDSLAFEESESAGGGFVFGKIDSVSEDSRSGLIYVHFEDKRFPVLPDSKAFNGIQKLPLPFEARIILEPGEGGLTYIVDVQPRYH